MEVAIIAAILAVAFVVGFVLGKLFGSNARSIAIVFGIAGVVIVGFVLIYLTFLNNGF